MFVFQWKSRIHCRLDLLFTLKLSVQLRFTNYHLTITEMYVTAENRATRSWLPNQPVPLRQTQPLPLRLLLLLYSGLEKAESLPSFNDHRKSSTVFASWKAGKYEVMHKVHQPCSKLSQAGALTLFLCFYSWPSAKHNIQKARSKHTLPWGCCSGTKGYQYVILAFEGRRGYPPLLHAVGVSYAELFFVVLERELGFRSAGKERP